MKRLIAFALLSCLLLCGCCISAPPAETEPQANPATEPSIENTPATAAPTQGTEPQDTEPAPTEAPDRKVTVYLLTKSTIYDSGSTEYSYDRDYNIDSFKVSSIENTVMYETYFEKKDANGMAGQVRMHWLDTDNDEIRSLTYENGKLKNDQIVGSNFSGVQYEYDQNGNRTEKREYYEGMLESVVCYEYAGQTLKAVYCESNFGSRIYECRIQNGRITQKVYLDTDTEYGYRYTYDDNGNVAAVTFYSGDETIPGDQYFYQAVEVDADRAPYLLEQQKYLLSIT